MNLTNQNKVIRALSNLYAALADVVTTGVKSDPVLQPSCRAALQICLDRLYAALDSEPVDPANVAADLRFRTLALEAASHAEAILALAVGV
jgi:hypothetical protein